MLLIVQPSLVSESLPPMLIDEPPFGSAYAAIIFAFNYSARARPKAAMAERELLKSAKERYPNESFSIRPTSFGKDGAAQAGMIRLQIDEAVASKLGKECLFARFAMAPRLQHERIKAIATIATVIKKDLGVQGAEGLLITTIVMHLYLDSVVTKRLMSDAWQNIGISQATFYRRLAHCKQTLEEVERRSIALVAEALQIKGVIA